MNAAGRGINRRAADGCDLDFVLVTADLLRAFAHGELSEPEVEAMQAFLDDHPDLRREIGAPGAARRTPPMTG